MLPADVPSMFHAEEEASRTAPRKSCEGNMFVNLNGIISLLRVQKDMSMGVQALPTISRVAWSIYASEFVAGRGELKGEARL